MRIQLPVIPNPEQLPVLLTDTFALTTVRGAAGSGKTTSAAHRARKVIAGVAAQRRLDHDDSPIRALVLTFNRTLRGYIEQFIHADSAAGAHPIELTVDTFAKWAVSLVGYQPIIERRERADAISRLWSDAAPASRMSGTFVAGEVDYILGRFGRHNLEEYIGASREGRGNPALREPQRRQILDGVVARYLELLDARSLVDWNDLPQFVLDCGREERYDIVVADEVQDFTVQQIRAIVSKMKPRRSITFVIDTGQKIYPHVIYWNETGLDDEPVVHRLSNNYRNTAQIAQFVQPLLTGMRLDDDGTLPDYRNCRNREIGRTPELITGGFALQMAFTADQIRNRMDLESETVGILTMWGDPRGTIAEALRSRDIPFVPLQAERDWPEGPENVGWSTLHSAKGLEFDHVFILGFDREFLDSYGADPDDSDYLRQRRLLAMAITRARKSVVIGYRPERRSDIIDLLDANTYIVRNLDAPA